MAPGSVNPFVALESLVSIVFSPISELCATRLNTFFVFRRLSINCNRVYIVQTCRNVIYRVVSLLDKNGTAILLDVLVKRFVEFQTTRGRQRSFQ